jgi:hypothetical protein
MQRGDAIAQVMVRDKFRMFAGDEQQIAEALRPDSLRLAFDFVERQRHAQDRIVARKTAVSAIVDALIGQVERGEHADDLAEPLLRHHVRPPAHVFQQLATRRRNQLREIRQRQFRFGQAIAHGCDAGRLRTFHQCGQRQ